MSKITLTLALVAAVIAGSFSTAAVVEAKGMKGGHGHHGHHHRFRHFGFYAAPIVVATAPSCGWAYAKWQSTGSHYWKSQYYVCKGWW